MKRIPKPPKLTKRSCGATRNSLKPGRKISEAGREGPLDPKTVQLIKLSIAIGAMREGAVHSGVRKALASGSPLKRSNRRSAWLQVLWPAVDGRVFTWIHDEIDKQS
jgi:hypothetical protein